VALDDDGDDDDRNLGDLLKVLVATAMDLKRVLINDTTIDGRGPSATANSSA
jgi:hypothetical protein